MPTPIEVQQNLVGSLHDAAMTMFTAAINRPADSKELTAEGQRFNAMVSYLVIKDFNKLTQDFADLNSQLSKDVADVKAGVAKLETAVAAAKTIVEIATIADQTLAIAAGIASKMH